jgi:hypothetical protein
MWRGGTLKKWKWIQIISLFIIAFLILEVLLLAFQNHKLRQTIKELTGEDIDYLFAQGTYIGNIAKCCSGRTDVWCTWK